MYGSCTSINVLLQKNRIYLFCILSYCTYNTKERHFKIRLSIFKQIINEKEHHKEFIVDLPIVNNAKDYKKLFSRNGEYGGSAEFACISRLLSNYLFEVHYENSTNAVNYCCIYYAFCVMFCIKYI